MYLKSCPRLYPSLLQTYGISSRLTHFENRRWKLFTLVWVFAVVLIGCSQQGREATGRLDTPEHHVLRGHDTVEKGDWKRAEREFNLALGLDENYAPAHAGIAIVAAHASADPLLSRRQKEIQFKRAQNALKKAFNEVSDKAQQLEVHLAAIRVERFTKEKKKWLKEAESHYRKAVKLSAANNRDARSHLYMARARRDAFQLPKAEDLYRRVLALDSPLNSVADDELALVQKVRRAAPGSLYGKRIAFDEQITRVDIAALFISELRLDRLYRRGGRSAQFQASTANSASPDVPQDIINHPLRSDIEEVLRLGVAGLEVSPRGRFLPNEVITRAEFALMVEDILAKVTGEKDLKTRFIGQNSPFPDVRSDLPYFNAVQTVVSRSLMEPKDKINGIFAPLDPVNPADGLIVIRLLKNELRSYVR